MTIVVCVCVRAISLFCLSFLTRKGKCRVFETFFCAFFQDNLSRGNIGAVQVLQEQFQDPGRLQFIHADLGDPKAVSCILGLRDEELILS